MNYVKEVAKLLGVELNEEFELMGEPGTRYRLVEVSDFDHCLEVEYSENWYTTSENSDEASLEDLICGRYAIKKLPWKPKKDDFYFAPMALNGKVYVNSYRWKNLISDIVFWKAGFCFRTAEEAKAVGIEQARELLKEFND